MCCNVLIKQTKCFKKLPIIDLKTVISLYNSLIQYTSDLRDCIWSLWTNWKNNHPEAMSTKLREKKLKIGDF